MEFQGDALKSSTGLDVEMPAGKTTSPTPPDAFTSNAPCVMNWDTLIFGAIAMYATYAIATGTWLAYVVSHDLAAQDLRE